ncbi:MAG: hypothetical protein L3J62_05885 [Gammaproteobacteria bacterium]|nr:hypothetical protein [Gammaproteobacteria bacterium]MCF6230308.1 hypothetical protein [Gammaproteobacteria bacterium]
MKKSYGYNEVMAMKKTLQISLLLLFMCCAGVSLAEQKKGVERITLEKTDVIGSQELPRILSIISWKQTKPMDLPLLHKPLEMSFNPIDEKEFSREISLRQKMKGQ